MLDFYDDPDFVRELMDLVVEIGISFGHAQIEAGAEIIGIGDAAASLIGLALYEEFVWPGEQRLVSAMHDAGVICRLHICGNNRRFLPSAARLGCEIIDIDAPVTMAAARQAVGVEQVLCGNLDPVRSIHEGTPDEIRANLRHVMQMPDRATSSVGVVRSPAARLWTISRQLSTLPA